MSTEVARRGTTPLTHPARYNFDSEQIAAMRRTVAKDCTDSEFVMFLEVCGRYELDPFAKHIYAAKMPGTNGGPPAVQIIVARDGLLAIANRHSDFGGVEGDVVRKGDRLARKPDGSFEHSYEGLADERDQLPIVGAWAKCYRAGRVPTFFFARFSSYKTNNKTWTKYPDAMILKVAEAMALRKAYSIAGIVGEDEIGVTYETRNQPTGDSGEFADQEPDFGPVPEVAAYLKALFEAANEVRPGSFLPQKVRITMAGKTQEERIKIVHDVEQFILKNGGTLPEVAEEPPEDDVPDAEVVHDEE